MRILYIESKDSFSSISKLLDQTDSVAIDPAFIESVEEIKLAHYLAEKSFKNGKNISKQLRYEFLLWLSGKKDISSAFSACIPKNGHYLIICFGKSLPKISGIKKKLELKKEATPIQIEKISLSRIL